MIGIKTRLRAIAIVGAACSLAACASDPPAPAPIASSTSGSSASATTQALVGRWGVAAYHRDSDRERTQKEARAQCANAYVIKAGPTGGVMMHLADEKEPFELKVRAEAGGRAILGPDNAPDAYNDRELTAFDGNSFTTRWLDAEIAKRYGVTVYARCGAAQPARATTKIAARQ